jgi:hypothetical protein
MGFGLMILGSFSVGMRMRQRSLAALIFSTLIPALALSQAPAGGASAPSTTKDPCPGGTAFIEKERARDAALHPQAEVPPTQPGLRTELKEMAARDQEARMASIQSPGAASSAGVASIDAVNLAKLKSIVAEFGFPTLAMVGRGGVQDAWLLTQHADSDLDFQKHALALIEASANAEVRPGDLAMLSDRIRIHEGKPQRFGSNFDLKTMQPTPIEDPEHVEQRRAQVHLMPMADYRCEMRQMYGATK